MGAEPGSIEWALEQPWPRYLIDHNIPWLFGGALRRVGYAALAASEVELENDDDPVVIQYCGDNHMVWVTEDFDARRRGQYVALVRELEVSAILLRPPAGKGWDIRMKFEVLARNLRTLEDAFLIRRPRYFVCSAKGAAREVSAFSAAVRPRRK